MQLAPCQPDIGKKEPALSDLKGETRRLNGRGRRDLHASAEGRRIFDRGLTHSPWKR